MNISAQFDSVPELMEFVDTIAGRQVAKPAAAPEPSAPASEEPQEAEEEVPEIITLVPEPAPVKPEAPAKPAKKAKAAPAPAPAADPAPAKAPEVKTDFAYEVRQVMERTRARLAGGDYMDKDDRSVVSAANKEFRNIAAVLGVGKPTAIKTQAQLDAFDVACSRLQLLDDGTVGVPEEDVPF